MGHGGGHRRTWEGEDSHAPDGDLPAADGSRSEAVPAVLAAHPDVGAFGMGGAGDVGLGGLRLDVLALEPVEGDILPPSKAGRRRRQVAFAVMWQATILACAALALGVPLGLAAGRWAWRAFADQLGVVAQPVVPLPTVLFTLAAAALPANAAAALPARAAARTAAAVVLRTE